MQVKFDVAIPYSAYCIFLQQGSFQESDRQTLLQFVAKRGPEATRQGALSNQW